MASHRDLSLYQFALERYQTAEPEHIRPTALITGDDLIALGYRPGPDFRRMLTLVEDAQLEGTVHTREEALALIADSFPNPSSGGRKI
jgi:poly(A) polymerase